MDSGLSAVCFGVRFCFSWKGRWNSGARWVGATEGYKR